MLPYLQAIRQAAVTIPMRRDVGSYTPMLRLGVRFWSPRRHLEAGWDHTSRLRCCLASAQATQRITQRLRPIFLHLRQPRRALRRCVCALYREEFSGAVKRSRLKYKSRQVQWRQWGGKRPADKWHPPNLRGRTCRSGASSVYSIL
jgi:hypothetical protein